MKIHLIRENKSIKNILILTTLASLTAGSLSRSFIMPDVKHITENFEYQNRRILENFGSYQIDSSRVEDSCGSLGLGDIRYSEEKFQADIDKIDHFFTFAREPFELFLTKNDSSEAKKAGWKAVAILSPFILLVLVGLIVFPIMLIYMFCKCTTTCCRNSVDDSSDSSDDESNEQKRKKKEVKMKRA